MSANESFLSRWSRRKRAGEDAEETAPREPRATEQVAASAAVQPPAVPEQAPGDASADPAEPPLPPIESLRPDSDFTPFMKAGIAPSTRASALRRLFADPHFNQMDGLDIYIDDYGKPDPIPLAMLKAMNQARSLGLFSESGKEDDAAPVEPVGAGEPSDPVDSVAAMEPGRPGEPSVPVQVALGSERGAAGEAGGAIARDETPTGAVPGGAPAPGERPAGCSGAAAPDGAQVGSQRSAPS